MATIGTIFYSTSDRIFSRFDTIYERVGRTNIAPAHRRQKWHANGQCFRVTALQLAANCICHVRHADHKALERLSQRTVQCFVSLSVSLSHSTSFDMLEYMQVQ